MKRKWRVLFVGLGSAGQRHLRNVKALLGDEVTVLAYRKRGYSRVFDEKMQIVEGGILQSFYAIEEYEDYEMALEKKPDIVFITNPNRMHIEYALKAASAGCHLFIEKPLSDTLKGTDELLQKIKKNHLTAYIGFQNRLNPCIKKTKKILEQQKIGKIIVVFSEVGELLSSMHAYEDYRQMTESRSELGGGVVNCQCHELDYLYYLFGLPEQVTSIGGKRSSLDIDAEDTATTLCRYNNDGREFAAVIQQDFIQYPPVRRCKIVGESGRIEFDLLANKLLITTSEGTTAEEFKQFQRNDMFKEELSLFLESINSGAREFVSLEDAMGSLKMAAAIKESFLTGKTVDLKEPADE